MRQVRLAVVLAACALGALPALAAAAPKSAAERAKVLQQVVDCRKITDSAERLTCYDRSAQALDDAEKTGQVVVVDQAKAREIRRQSFGFSLPSLSVLNLAGKGDILSLFAGTLPFPMVEREKSHEATAQPAQPAPQASSMHHAHSHASSIHTRIIHLRLPVHTMPAMLP